MTSETCAGATASVIGAPGCVAIDDCDAPFPPASATHVVRASFRDDELDATHFRTIGAALAAVAGAPLGKVIAVDDGTYAEGLSLNAPIVLTGRCAARVVLDGAAAGGPGVRITNGATVSGLTVRGFPTGVSVEAGPKARIVGVVVEDSRGVGVLVARPGTQLEASRLLVRATRAGTTLRGVGIEVSDGAALVLRDAAVIDATEIGVSATGAGVKVTMATTVVRATRSTATGDFGMGVLARAGADVEIEGSLLDGNREAGLATSGAATRVRLRDVMVRGTRPSRAGFGRGLFVTGSTLEGDQVLIDDNADVGVAVEGAGARVTLRGSAITATRAGEGGVNGIGASVKSGTTLVLEDSALVGNRTHGVFADGAGARATLTRSLVSGTRASDAGTVAGGILGGHGARVELTASALLGNAQSGIHAYDAGTLVRAVGCIVADGVPLADGKFGRGATVQELASLEIVGCVLAQNRDIAVSATGSGTRVTIEGSVVRDTRELASTGGHGRALEVNGGARGVLRGSTLARNANVGALVSGAGSSLVVDGSFVLDTALDGKTRAVGRGLAAQNGASLVATATEILRSAQAGVSAGGAGTTLGLAGCVIGGTKPSADGSFGHGAFVFEGATARIESTDLVGSAGVGMVVSASSATLEGGRVRGNAVGVHAQDGTAIEEVAEVPADPTPRGFAITRATVFEDNALRVGGVDVPLPTPLD